MNNPILQGAFDKSCKIIDDLRTEGFTSDEIIFIINLMGQEISYFQNQKRMGDLMGASKQTIKETIKEIEEGK